MTARKTHKQTVFNNTLRVTDVTDAEWDLAEAYFANNPKENQLKKSKNKSINHTFMKVNGEVYVLQAGQYLGEGAFKLVKVVQNRKKETFALTIEASTPKKNIVEKLIKEIAKRLPRTREGQQKREEKRVVKEFVKAQDVKQKEILSDLGDFKGETTVDYKRSKKWGHKNSSPKIRGKKYTIQTLKSGVELRKLISDKKGMSEETKLLIAKKACENIASLHQRGVIHCDIKPENFMADLNRNDPVVACIDFGFSQKLAPGKDRVVIPGISAGTQGYCAPEIIHYSNYRKESDIYSLGYMLVNDFGLTDPIFEQMMAFNPKDRPSLESVIEHLNKQQIKLRSSPVTTAYRASTQTQAPAKPSRLPVDERKNRPR